MATQEEHDKGLENWKNSQTHIPTYGYGSHDPWAPQGQQYWAAGWPVTASSSISINTGGNISPEKDGININLNFFLRLLGATKEVIDDDQKTLEFMMDIKKRLDEANGVTATEVKPNEHEDED